MENLETKRKMANKENNTPSEMEEKLLVHCLQTKVDRTQKRPLTQFAALVDLQCRDNN